MSPGNRELLEKKARLQNNFVILRLLSLLDDEDWENCYLTEVEQFQLQFALEHTISNYLDAFGASLEGDVVQNLKASFKEIHEQILYAAVKEMLEEES